MKHTKVKWKSRAREKWKCETKFEFLCSLTCCAVVKSTHISSISACMFQGFLQFCCAFVSSLAHERIESVLCQSLLVLCCLSLFKFWYYFFILKKKSHYVQLNWKNRKKWSEYCHLNAKINSTWALYFRFCFIVCRFLSSLRTIFK